jgi:spermidine synthase
MTDDATEWVELAAAHASSGERLVLRRRGLVFEIRCDGWELMSSRAHHSEQAMARLVSARLAEPAPLVLIGGLGMGYTLRAMLDTLSPAARITVAEIFGEVVAWNRGPLAPLAGRPLDDSRVSVRVGDVAAVLDADAAGFDAVVLDIDNGPEAVMLAGNRSLYAPAGLRRVRAALRPAGVLAVWSADASAAFEEAMEAAGFAWGRVLVAARGIAGDPEHAIYLAFVSR